MGEIRTGFFLPPTRLRIDASETCRTHIVDNAETRFVNGGRLADELSRLLPRHFHVQNARLAIANMTLHFRHTIAGRDQALCQFSAISCEERHYLEAECGTLLDGDAKKRPQPISNYLSDGHERFCPPSCQLKTLSLPAFKR